MRTDTGSGRHYEYKGETFISVTNALSNGYPKPALPRWAAKVVGEYVVENLDEVNELAKRLEPAELLSLIKGKPWMARDKAADLGSLVHDIAEQYAVTGELPDLAVIREEARKKAAQYFAFLEQVQPSFHAIEGIVFNRRFGYAGAFDAIMDINHPLSGTVGRYIVDIKTGKGVYAEAALQQAAYRYGEFIAVGDEEVPMPEVDGALILHLQQTQWRLVPVDTSESSFNTFRAALHVAKYRTTKGEGYENEAVGPPVMKGRAS